MEPLPERDDAGAGAGERHGGLRPILLLDRAADARQSGVRRWRWPFCLAPLVATLPYAQREISFSALLGELAVGLVYGLTLALLNEMLLFAGQIAGLQFSFSLVNLLDPASAIQTPLLGELFQLMGTLVDHGRGARSHSAGFDGAQLSGGASGQLRDGARDHAGDCPCGGRHLSCRCELAAPVLAATLLVEIAVSLLGKLSPQLPVMSLTVPLKTLTGFALLDGLAGASGRALSRRVLPACSTWPSG